MGICVIQMDMCDGFMLDIYFDDCWRMADKKMSDLDEVNVPLHNLLNDL